MTFPKEHTPLLESTRCLFEALIELDDEQTVALSKLNKNVAKPFVYLVSICVMCVKKSPSILMRETETLVAYKRQSP